MLYEITYRLSFSQEWHDFGYVVGAALTMRAVSTLQQQYPGCSVSWKALDTPYVSNQRETIGGQI